MTERMDETDEAPRTIDVVEHRVIEVAPTHIAVPAEDGRLAHERGQREATERALERERAREDPPFEPYQARKYFDFLAGRRVNRYTASGIALAGLTIVAAVWFLLGGSGSDSVTGLAPSSLAIGGVVVLIVGFGLAWLCRGGHFAGLALGWLAGLGAMVLAVGMLATVDLAPAGVGTVLTAAMGFTGLVTLVTTTLGLASWRGVRSQRRMLGPRSVV